MTQEVYLLQRKFALINYALTVDSVEFARNFLLRVRRLRRSSSVLFGLERRLCFADKQFCSASSSTGIIASRRLRIPLVASAPLAVWDAWLKCAISTGFAQGIPPKALQNLRLLY